MHTFQYSFEVNAPLERVWAFHDDPLALPKVMTGPVRMRVNHVDRPLQPGSRILMTMHIGPIPVRWNVRLKQKVPMHFFTDEQIEGEGPFKRWVHTHVFEPIEPVEPVDGQHTRIIDRLEYALPLGWLGRLAAGLFGGMAMRMMFASRARATRALLEAEASDRDAVQSLVHDTSSV
jgi:ligand-binding SRPBCC domain-containing protein